jgi:1-acyl-sn-glycerol-3-phosphate acyltransferase
MEYILIGLGIIIGALILTVLLFYLFFMGLYLYSRNKPYNHPTTRKALKYFSKGLIKLFRVKYTVIGRENVPNNNFLFFGNHQTAVDPFILLAEFPDCDMGG